MRLALAMIVAGCGGTTIVTPTEGTRVQLVRCVVAPAPPAVADAPVAIERTSERERAEPPPASRRAIVGLGDPIIIGSLDQRSIVPAIETALPGLRKCLAYEITRGANSRSVIQYRLNISSTGEVVSASSTSRALGPSLERCVREVLSSVVFAASSSGGTTSLTCPITFDSTQIEPERHPVAEIPWTQPWTPFAIASDGAPRATGVHAARATEAALRTKLGAIDACFARSAARGSLRAVLALDAEGRLSSLRLGGLGDAEGERCATRVITNLQVLVPSSALVEVACDLARGDARPWRVTPAAGYGVIETSAKHVTYGTRTIEPGAPDPTPIAETKTFLVLLDRNTPGAILDLALAWAADDVVVVAIRDDGAPPLFLGIGRTSASSGATSVEAIRPTLRIGTRTLTSCVDRSSQQTKLADPVAIGTLVRRVADKCRKLTCTGTLAIAVDADARAGSLVEVIGAARRAGFDRVLIGGETGCRPIAP
ncbi:MAG: hypothetical protein WKG01_15040 [Kofleriaceae bacterium]